MRASPFQRVYSPPRLGLPDRAYMGRHGQKYAAPLAGVRIRAPPPPKRHLRFDFLKVNRSAAPLRAETFWPPVVQPDQSCAFGRNIFPRRCAETSFAPKHLSALRRNLFPRRTALRAEASFPGAARGGAFGVEMATDGRRALKRPLRRAQIRAAHRQTAGRKTGFQEKPATNKKCVHVSAELPQRMKYQDANQGFLHCERLFFCFRELTGGWLSDKSVLDISTSARNDLLFVPESGSKTLVKKEHFSEKNLIATLKSCRFNCELLKNPEVLRANRCVRSRDSDDLPSSCIICPMSRHCPHYASILRYAGMQTNISQLPELRLGNFSPGT